MADVRAERRQRGEPQDRRRQQPEARLRAADPVPREQGRDREGHGRQGRPRLHGRARGAAELRARRPLGCLGDEAGRRGHGRRGRRLARAHGQAEPLLRSRRTARRPRATASWSTSSAASTARSSRAARARTSRSISAPTPSSRASRSSSKGLKAGDTKLVKVTFPENYPAAHLAGKAAEFDVTVKEHRGAGRAEDRRRARQGLRHGILDKLKDAVQPRDPARLRRPVPPQGQEGAARRARRQVHLRTAAEPGRAGIRRRLGAGRRRDEERREDLRGRGHDRGGGARRLPQDRRASGSARTGPCADRREGRYQGLRRRGHAGPRRAGPPVPRPGEARSGSSTRRTPRPWPRSAPRSSRRRSSTTSSAR